MMATMATTRYRFTQHARRISRFTIVLGIVFILSLFIILLGVGVLAAELGTLVAAAGILAVVSFAFLLPLLLFVYSYGRAGVWIEPERVRVQFPGESAQAMDWAEALFAIDEGEEYLRLSRGKEGLGHLVGQSRYIRLHLEGMMPEQRTRLKEELGAHVAVRHPRCFTLITLMNTKGEVEARGRLYVLEHDVLCMENRGEKRVFFCGPLQDLTSVRQRDPFYVGRLECEALTLRYQRQDYIVMFGYETTLASNIGSSSHWSATGSAEEWIEVLTGSSKAGTESAEK